MTTTSTENSQEIKEKTSDYDEGEEEEQRQRQHILDEQEVAEVVVTAEEEEEEEESIFLERDELPPWEEDLLIEQEEDYTDNFRELDKEAVLPDIHQLISYIELEDGVWIVFYESRHILITIRNTAFYNFAQSINSLAIDNLIFPDFAELIKAKRQNQEQEQEQEREGEGERHYQQTAIVSTYFNDDGSNNTTSTATSNNAATSQQQHLSPPLNISIDILNNRVRTDQEYSLYHINVYGCYKIWKLWVSLCTNSLQLQYGNSDENESLANIFQNQANIPLIQHAIRFPEIIRSLQTTVSDYHEKLHDKQQQQQQQSKSKEGEATPSFTVEERLKMAEQCISTLSRSIDDLQFGWDRIQSHLVEKFYQKK